MTRKLDVHQTAALCMEMSGNLSRQLRTYLKTECGVDIESRSKVTAYLQTAYFPNETGKVTVPDPKKKGQTKTASFLRVNPDLYSVLELLQKVADQNQEAGRVSWPANVPSDEWWIQLLADKGGGCTKLVLKMICIVGADSVRRVVPIGLLDGVSDTREMVELAFGPLLKTFSEIERYRYAIYTKWAPRTRQGITLNADLQPIREVTVAANNLITTRLKVMNVGESRVVHLGLFFKGTKARRFRKLKFSQEEEQPPPSPSPRPHLRRSRRRRRRPHLRRSRRRRSPPLRPSLLGAARRHVSNLLHSSSSPRTRSSSTRLRCCTSTRGRVSHGTCSRR